MILAFLPHRRVGEQKMKRIVFLALVGLVATSAHAQSLTTVPSANAAVEGSSGLNTIIRSEARTLQTVISASELTSMLNGQITGLTFRLDGSEVATRPDFAINFANYDIYLGQAATTPSTLSNTFASNYIPGTKTQLRGGALSLAAGYFPRTNPAGPNDFAAIIGFNLSGGNYSYTGGDLVIELTHTGNSATDFGLDAQANSAQVAAVGSPGYNALTNTGVNASLAPVMRLQFTPAVTAAPEPGTLALLGLGAFGLVVRRRRTA